MGTALMVVSGSDPENRFGARKMHPLQGRIARHCSADRAVTNAAYNRPQAATPFGRGPTNTLFPSSQPTRSRLVSPMRELEREPIPSPQSKAAGGGPFDDRHLAIVGRGRVGRSLARAAEAAGIRVRLAGRRDAV